MPRKLQPSERELNPADYPGGTIGIPAGEHIRYGAFAHSLACVATPPETRITMMSSVSLVENLNVIVRTMAGEWIWWQADDHSWDSWTLCRLLERLYPTDGSEPVDVVVPLMVKRSPPFSLLIFKDKTEEGWMSYAWDEMPPMNSGLMGPIAGAGTGGMLIKRSVIERIIAGQGHDRVFEYQAGEILNEDLILCEKIKDPELGNAEIWADVGVTIGHRGGFTAQALQDQEGNWGVAFNMGVNPQGKPSTIFISGNRQAMEMGDSIDEKAADTSG